MMIPINRPRKENKRLSIDDICDGKLPSSILKRYMLYQDNSKLRELLKIRILESYAVEHLIDSQLETASDMIRDELMNRFNIIYGWVNGSFNVSCSDREFDSTWNGVDVITIPLGLNMWDFDRLIYRRCRYDYFRGIDNRFSRNETEVTRTQLNSIIIIKSLINEK